MSTYVLIHGAWHGRWCWDNEFLLQYAGQDDASAVTANLIVAEDHSCASVRADALREAFYGDCSYEDSMRATSLLVPQSVAPLFTPVSTSSQNFGRIPRVYISCLRDRAITPVIKKLMYSNVPCELLIQMDTSHSPFLSAPEELAGHLLSL